MRKISLLLISGVLALSLTACGSSKSSESANSMKYSDSAVSESAGARSADSYGLADNYSYDAAEPEVYEDTAVEETAEGVTSDSTVSDKENKDNKLNMEKLIYRCSISLETKDFEGDIKAFQQLVDKYDGFVENENTSTRTSTYTYDNSYNSSGKGLGQYTATVRVPSSKYKDFVNEAGSIGTLNNKSQNVTNVSQEYSDLSIELDVLEAQRGDYMEMLKEAKSLEDMDNVILISDKIASVNTEINQIKSRLNSIDNDVAYSYIDISITEVKEIVEHSEDTFGDRFMKEVKQGWYDFFYGLQNFLIWIVANIWGLLLFALIVFIIIFIIRKIVKRSQRKYDEKQAKLLEQSMQAVKANPNGQGMNKAPTAPAPNASAPQNAAQNPAASAQQNAAPNTAASTPQNAATNTTQNPSTETDTANNKTSKRFHKNKKNN